MAIEPLGPDELLPEGIHELRYLLEYRKELEHWQAELDAQRVRSDERIRQLVGPGCHRLLKGSQYWETG